MHIYLCDNCNTLATVKVLTDTIQITKCKCQTEQKEEQTMTQTVKFASFPFTHKGYNFVSKVAETNRFLPQTMLMGEDFITMNRGAIDECMPDIEDMSWASIEKEIYRINEGGTEMFLELVGIA
jgi:hypothetical protein